MSGEEDKEATRPVQEPTSPASTDTASFRRTVSSGVILLLILAVFLLFALLLMVQFGRGYWLSIALNHFPAVIGLPCSAAGAFMVVMLLRSSEGPLEFEGLGFRFKGASGPVVLWVMCFLAIVLAIRVLWPLATTWGS